jgi:tetratricopeptide (TPR) repeat protein
MLRRENSLMPVDLKGALDDHRRGRLDQAASVYQAALAENPDNPDALHLLGLVAIQRGDPAQGVSLIGRAVELRPDDAASHSNLAEAYRACGQIDRAVASCQRAIELQPQYPEAHSNLALILLRRGEIEAAITHFREAIRQQPRFASAHNGLGNALRQKGDRAAALAHYKIAVALDPRSAEAHSNLGRVLMEEGDPKLALLHSEEAVRLRPHLAAALTNLANVLIVHGRLDEAKARLLEAVRLEPGVAAIHTALAHLWERLGELDKAELSLREALRCDPEDPLALARLAIGMRGELPPDDQAKIEGVLANPALRDEPRWQLQFGLAQACDAKGQYDRAAEASIEANKLLLSDMKRRSRVYDPAEHCLFVTRLIATFTPEYFARVRGLGLTTERPVFVVGLPRSGTSLTEQVLASHPRVFGAGELWLAQDTFELLPAKTGRPGTQPIECVQELDRQSIARIAGGYLEKLAALNSSADRIVDKLPENTHYLGLIATLFPRAKLIHCRRDPRDVALSCWMTNFAHVRWACDVDHIAGRIHEYQRLMEHWRRVLPIPLFEFDYETLVDDLEGTARQLVAWCGLEWDAACLEFHKTQRAVRSPSAGQVRQPVYKSSVGRWRNYERSLPALFDKLGN